MLNVDAGNSPERPENPPELRATWRLTWLAIIGLVILALLFVAVGRMRTESGAPDTGAQQEERMPGPGERERSY
jgi:hypothetical protein